MKRWKNRARRWLLLLVLAVLAAGTALPAAADMGPKPSVEVVFQGLEGQRFYATLLGNVTQYGPWSADEEYLDWRGAVSFSHLRAHETGSHLVCRLFL